MRTKAYQNYFDDEVLEASPLKLVQLLYRGALESLASARRYLRSGDIRAGSLAIDKAMAIVNELLLSLDKRQGGELGCNLVQLYGYVQRLLMQANFEQREAPLIEAEGLLSTLLEAWTNCALPEQETDALRCEADPPVSCPY
jgi:flagellar protein FliS